MDSIKYLKCLNCLNATMRVHPEASHIEYTKFNNLIKCGHCGYTADKGKHEQDIDNRLKEG